MILISLALVFLAIILRIVYFLVPSLFEQKPKIRTSKGKKLKDLLEIVPKKPIFGNNFDFLALDVDTFFTFFRDKAKKYRRSYLMHSFTKPIYNVITAEDAEYVLNNSNTISKGIVYKIFEPFLGRGLLTSTGKKWFARRKMLTPSFHFNILQQFIEIFKEESEKFVTTVRKKTANGNEEISLNDIIPRFTLNNVCETAMGIKLDDTSEGDSYRKNVDMLEDMIIKRSLNAWMFSDYFYKFFGDKRLFDKYVEKVHTFSSQIIQNRRLNFLNNKNKLESMDGTDRKRRYAMLDTLLAAELEGKSINHKGICEEVDTFMFEGYDTTSVSLIFTLLMLAHHPDVQKSLYEEIHTFTEDVFTVGISEINQMKYLECVVKESLRLYPSVPLISRYLQEEVKIGDITFPPETQILVHIFDIHRDPRHYPDPDKFDPERFRPENTTNRHPYAYVPFSAGPRNCIGQKFALLEMKMLLINVLLNYHIHPVTKLDEVKFEGGMVLRSKYPVKVKFVARTQ